MTCVGRFAPSPTGDLHLGSLVSAVGSYLDARSRGGRWLLRVEDIDRPREVPGAAARMLATLRAFGLDPDGPVLYQSTRLARYDEVLEDLRRRGRLFACDCSRRLIASAAAGTPAAPRLGVEGRSGLGTPIHGERCCIGGCRQRAIVDRDASLRVCFTGLDPLAVEDRSLGPVRFDPRVHRDLVVRRRDGIHAYHLAVVVDDHDSGVTDVVRGADLLEATAWQIGLQCLLGMPAPGYLHLPVVTEADGSKLAKSHRTVALDACSATSSLRLALSLLSQDVPPPARGERPAGLLRLAQARWDPARFRGRRCVPLVADARC